MNDSALMVIVETAAAALEKMAELLELGHANVLVKDLANSSVMRGWKTRQHHGCRSEPCR
jgi:hypothetical protein